MIENESFIKTSGIINISCSILMIMFGIFLITLKPNEMFGEGVNSMIYQNLPFTYKFFLNLIFKNSILFGTFLIIVSIFTIFTSINFIRYKKWTYSFIKGISLFVAIAVIIYWMSFLYFIFNVSSTVPDLNIRKVNLLIFKIFGFIISLIHLVVIIPVFRLIRKLHRNEIKNLFK